ncbi:MAG: hypothetical protein CL608_12070 [Anaerolineaceae bacterium]|nr:hypothetical protein [Anaerolineaceae bacterium]
MDSVQKVISYEVDMVRELVRCSENADFLARQPWYLQNAITESLVLHTRILVEVFLSDERKSSDKRHSDDISLCDLTEADTTEVIEELRRSYGSNNDPTSVRWQFNKMMAHATTNRGASHDYGPFLKRIFPALFKVIDLLEKEHSEQRNLNS